jgi:hypothetical protein
MKITVLIMAMLAGILTIVAYKKDPHLTSRSGLLKYDRL